MRDKNDKQSIIILSVLGIVPVIWLGLCIAPSVHGGLAEIIPALSNAINNPFDISLCEDSLKNCPHFAFNLCPCNLRYPLKPTQLS